MAGNKPSGFSQCGTAVDSILQAPTSGQEDHLLFTLLYFIEEGWGHIHQEGEKESNK